VLLLQASVVSAGRDVGWGWTIASQAVLLKLPPMRSKTVIAELSETAFITMAAFVYMNDYKDRDVQILRDSDATPVKLKTLFHDSTSDGTLTAYSLPPQSTRFGVAKREPMEFEFYVQPPPRMGNAGSSAQK